MYQRIRALSLQLGYDILSVFVKVLVTDIGLSISTSSDEIKIIILAALSSSENVQLFDASPLSLSLHFQPFDTFGVSLSAR